jgi:integrase
MPHLCPPTLTAREQRALLRASVANPRDHLLISLALGTGLRLAEIVGLDVGDVFQDGTPRGRIRLRSEIAKRGRARVMYSSPMRWSNWTGSGESRSPHRHGGPRSLDMNCGYTAAAKGRTLVKQPS